MVGAGVSRRRPEARSEGGEEEKGEEGGEDEEGDDGMLLDGEHIDSVATQEFEPM